MIRRTAIAIGGAAAVSLLAVASAAATFPGANGRIAYTRYDSSLHTVLPSGHGDAQIGPPYGASLSWSPNGRRLAFVSIKGDRYRVSLMAADGSHVRQLTDPRTSDFSPSFAPGGHKVLFTRVGRFTSRLMTVGTDGSDLRTVVRGGGGGAWSPDGREIAFDTRNGGIRAIRPNGTDEHVLTSKPRDGLSGYSPNGRRITFVRKRKDKKWVTMIARSDGSHVRRLPCLPAPRDSALEVTYSPDGRWFLGAMPVPSPTDPRFSTNTLIRFPVRACMNGTMRQQRIVRLTSDFPSWQPLLSH